MISLPTEIKSTPVCAISLTVLKLIPPEASKTAPFIIFVCSDILRTHVNSV